MSRGELGPSVEAYARRTGAEAAAKRNAGERPVCPYDRNSPSITIRRLAVVWWDALLDNLTERPNIPLP
jgi:hypothetical protein